MRLNSAERVAGGHAQVEEFGRLDPSLHVASRLLLLYDLVVQCSGVGG